MKCVLRSPIGRTLVKSSDEVNCCEIGRESLREVLEGRSIVWVGSAFVENTLDGLHEFPVGSLATKIVCEVVLGHC